MKRVFVHGLQQDVIVQYLEIPTDAIAAARLACTRDFWIESVATNKQRITALDNFNRRIRNVAIAHENQPARSVLRRERAAAAVYRVGENKRLTKARVSPVKI